MSNTNYIILNFLNDWENLTGVYEVFGNEIQFDPKFTKYLVCVVRNGPDAVDGFVCIDLNDVRLWMGDIRDKRWFIVPSTWILSTFPSLNVISCK